MLEVGAIEHDHVVDFAGGRWSGNVDSPAPCGAAVKRAGVAGKLLRVSVLRRRRRNILSSAWRVMSLRCTVSQAPHVLHRQRVLSAEVFSFLTSLLLHTPQRG